MEVGKGVISNTCGMMTPGHSMLADLKFLSERFTYKAKITSQCFLRYEKKK